LDGISRAAGVGPLITLCGEQYEVQGRILRHYATIEAEIIKRRGNPLQLVRECIEGLAGAESVSEVFDNPEMLTRLVSVMFDEAKRWRHLNEEWHGTVVATWLAIRHNDPKRLTVDKVGEMVSDDYEDRMRKEGMEAAEQLIADIFAAIDQAGGEDEMGESTGSPSSPASEEKTTEDSSPGT